jgi:predicted lipid-binding transport protein (Tim44 family)
MEGLLQNDLFHLVFGILAAIFLLGALVNAIRSRAQNNRRETARMIKNNGNTGNEHAPVRLENPFAAQRHTAAAPMPAPTSAKAPVPASTTVVAADNPTGQSVKAPADDDEEYVWR